MESGYCCAESFWAYFVNRIVHVIQLMTYIVEVVTERGICGCKERWWWGFAFQVVGIHHVGKSYSYGAIMVE